MASYSRRSGSPAAAIDERNQPIGFTGHGGNHHGNTVTAPECILDMACRSRDPVKIAERCASELLDDEGHD